MLVIFDMIFDVHLSFFLPGQLGLGLRVPYSCGVVLVFLVLAGNRCWCYVRTYLVYNTVMRLCQFFVVAGKLI